MNVLRAHPSNHLKEVVDYEYLTYLSRRAKISELDMYLWLVRNNKAVAGSSGTLSNYAETAIINHLNRRTTFTLPTALALALCTVVPTSAMTGATITEASYTGYGRADITSTGTMAAAVAGGAGAASTSTSSSSVGFAGCTGGSSTIIGWALCDNVTTGAGNVLWWGTCPSAVISTTQTPATVPSAGINQSLL